MSEGYRIHIDKIISLETAKLLGVPFTWSADVSGRVGHVAFKYVPTDQGLIIMQRYIRGSIGWVLYSGTLRFESTKFHPVEFEFEDDGAIIPE